MKHQSCTQYDCSNRHHAHGYCKKHYQRWLKRGSPHKTLNTIHGGIPSHPLYAVYNNMLARCSNVANTNFKYYGGRGIVVCDRWAGENGFLNFIADMGERPHTYQIDRRDVNGPYSPDNCRWVNKYQQMANTRRTGLTAGVTLSVNSKKWRARIKVDHKEISLGVWPTYEDAVAARKMAEQKYV